jgi:homoserine O-succinyltransferase
VALPHSRFNEIAETDMAGAGYQVVARCERTGWTVAAAERGQCQLVLLQGHPEYTPHQLLREYRRDVRRWLAGAQGSYPHIPEGYLDDEGVEVLAEFEREVTARPRDPGVMGHFPFDAAAGHIRAPWLVASRVLMANWMRYVRERHDAAAAPVSPLPVTPPPAVLADVGADQGLEPGGLPGA